ncbi:MAG: DUF4430 domain-containing protein [Candidatus Nealsonbacteria bacterium]
MKKIHIFTVIAIILVIIGWMGFSNKGVPPTSLEEVEISQQEVKQGVSLTIDNGEEPPKIIESEFREGTTVFDLLKEKTRELDSALKTKTYDFGVLIEAIGDKENGQDGKYWLYYVNGEMPMVVADKKEIKPGDKIEFKFEKSPF